MKIPVGKITAILLLIDIRIPKCMQSALLSKLILLKFIDCTHYNDVYDRRKNRYFRNNNLNDTKNSDIEGDYLYGVKGLYNDELLSNIQRVFDDGFHAVLFVDRGMTAASRGTFQGAMNAIIGGMWCTYIHIHIYIYTNMYTYIYVYINTYI
jgi:hypothetical protein